MSFSTWRAKEKREIAEEKENDIREGNEKLSDRIDDRLIQEYNSYESHLLVTKTHWLIIATLIFALATIGFSMINIYLYVIS